MEEEEVEGGGEWKKRMEVGDGVSRRTEGGG